MTQANHAIDRRGFLRRAGLAAGASAVLPLLGATGCGTATATRSAAETGDPDALFKAGDFAAAERGYAQAWREDSADAHAAAQLGYIALLSNRFRDAEYHLRAALRLTPGDTRSKQRLGDCYVRQDLPARAVPLLPQPQAAQLSALTGTPYETHGPQATRVPFLGMDPLPRLPASLNGAAPESFVLDTGAMPLTISTETANKAGLHAVSSMAGGTINGHTVTTYLGVLPSFRIGRLELRNVPVSWLDGEILDPDGTGTVGTIGTGFFYHFLTTIDYKGRALVLRRKTTAQRRAFRAAAARAGIRPQPLWLAGDHLPCTLGKINDYGPRVACIDSGSTTGLNISLANARRAGITVNTASPVPINGGTSSVYPITVDRMSIGNAINRNVPGSVGETPWEGMTGFDLLGNFTHKFFEPFAVTYDYVGMNLYVG
ncbi:aspartyl protease family protein [Actinoallomurus iriomotensis]|uniref:Aspartyl protease n=1 Tax=Actinoallomurus iriomotensis TaxID=478107 RepID=A0A9W6S180_9ACTN|nr:aspartyl protease family protein [Actinoallomurus iriomotensis]GLY86621.1 hypothetical protein Airi02_045500 [Actinoallomurus iriomotensis]